MAYTSGFTAVTGATFTAAQYNTNVRDNLTAIWVYTTAGDISYATGSTTLSRLGIGTLGESLTVGAGSAPAWRKPVGIWDVWSKAERASGSALTNTSYADISSLSVTLTLTRTCTVFGLLVGRIGADGATNSSVDVRLMIDGTAQTSGTQPNFSSVGFNVPLSVGWSRTGMTAGSRIVKAQNIVNSGGNMYVQGVLFAWAVVE